MVIFGKIKIYQNTNHNTLAILFDITIILAISSDNSNGHIAVFFIRNILHILINIIRKITCNPFVTAFAANNEQASICYVSIIQTSAKIIVCFKPSVVTSFSLFSLV